MEKPQDTVERPQTADDAELTPEELTKKEILMENYVDKLEKFRKEIDHILIKAQEDGLDKIDVFVIITSRMTMLMKVKSW